MVFSDKPVLPLVRLRRNYPRQRPKCQADKNPSLHSLRSEGKWKVRPSSGQEMLGLFQLLLWEVFPSAQAGLGGSLQALSRGHGKLGPHHLQVWPLTHFFCVFFLNH